LPIENLLLDEIKGCEIHFLARHGIAGFGLGIDPCPRKIRIFHGRTGVKNSRFSGPWSDHLREFFIDFMTGSTRIKSGRKEGMYK
jgi:hypothetical protein